MDSSSNSNYSLQLPQIIYDDPQYIKDFTDGREELLKLAFVGHERVNVEKPLSGYSGAQTWRVSTETNQFFVVKLAHPTVIEREDENYRRHVAGGLYRNAAHPEDRPFKSDNNKWALLKSTFLGLYQSQTLLQYLDKGSADIATILKNIFIDLGRQWWGAGAPTPIKCSVYYDRLLPAHLELDFFDGKDNGAIPLKAGEVTQSDITAIEEMVTQHQTRNILLKNFRPEKIRNGVLTITAVPQANVRSPQIKIKLSKVIELVPEEIRSDPNKTLAFLTEKLEEGVYANNITTRRQRIESYAEKAIDDFSPGRDTFVVESMRYPNPIVYLQKLLNENYNTKISPRIHGDLNLSNILIELDESNEGYQQAWLIDFAETGEGPILLDLQWLEEQVITKFLAPILATEMTKRGLSVNVLVDILEALHEFKELPRDLPSTIQKPYTVLQEIRRLVRDNNYLSLKNDQSEYYRGLVIALVGSLRFEDIGLLAQKVAFLSAAIIIRWTKVSPSDLPKRLAESKPLPPPTIDSNSVPEFSLPSRLFKLRGQARAGGTIQVLANKEVIETTVADHNGNWQAEISFDKVGLYRLTVRYELAIVESGSSSIRVIESPRIRKESIPEQIFAQKSFVLQGNAQPGAVVQVLANQQVLATTMTDDAGHWQTHLSLDKIGTYTIVVRDENHKVESTPVPVTVMKRVILTKALGFPLLIAGLLLAAALIAFLTPPGVINRVINSASTAIASRNISTPILNPSTLVTTTSAITQCNPQLPVVKIGIAINQTGSYAAFRKDQKIAYQIAREYYNKNNGINGRCIELVDNKDLASRSTVTDSKALQAIFQELVDDDKVVAIIGPGLSQQVTLIKALLEKMKTPVIGPSTTRPDLVCKNEYFGRVSAPGAWYIYFTLDQARGKTDKDKPKVAVAFANDDAFTIAESNAFTSYIKSNAGSYLLDAEDLYPYKINDPKRNRDNDLQDVAKQIKTSNPDIVIISGLTGDGKFLLKKLREEGFTNQVIGGNGLNTPYIFDGCKEGCNDFDNFFVPQAYNNALKDTQVQQDFINAYSAYPVVERPEFDPNPGQFAAQMFTAMQLIVESLREIPFQDADLREGDGLAKLREQLKTKLFSDANGDRPSVLGPLHLNTEGEVMQQGFYVAQSKKNQNGIGYHFEIINSFSVDPKKAALSDC